MGDCRRSPEGTTLLELFHQQIIKHRVAFPAEIQTDTSFGKHAVFDSADQALLMKERAIVSLASNFDLLGLPRCCIYRPAGQFCRLDCFDAARRHQLRRDRKGIISAIILSKDEPASASL